jgi:hypothetical protein
MRPADTSPEAWKVFLDIQRRMSPSEKLQRTLDWSEVTRRFVEGGLRERHPSADDHEILLRYARLTLGPELFQQAYGDVQFDDEPVSRHA